MYVYIHIPTHMLPVTGPQEFLSEDTHKHAHTHTHTHTHTQVLPVTGPQEFLSEETKEWSSEE